MVLVTMYLGKVVLIGATLSFIGLAEAGLAEWGNLVASGQSGILAGFWWTSMFGGAMVFLWALSCNLLGDGLRDLLNPKDQPPMTWVTGQGFSAPEGAGCRSCRLRTSS